MKIKFFIKITLFVGAVFFGKQHASYNYDAYQNDQRNLMYNNSINNNMSTQGHGPACPVCQRGQMCPVVAGCAPESSPYNMYPAPPEYSKIPGNR
jgi:hypothetical protein